MIILKTTGIVRKIDELGRVVIPKELRKNLNIHTGDDFQIIVDDERIILERYSRLVNVESEIIKIVNVFKNVYKYNIYIVYNNKFMCSKQEVSKNIIEIIQQRKKYISDNKLQLCINNENITGKLIIDPIVFDSDLLGAIIIVGMDNVNYMESVSMVIKELIKKNL